LSSADLKQQVGEVAATIRKGSVRRTLQGQGIRYEGEQSRARFGKAGMSTATKQDSASSAAVACAPKVSARGASGVSVFRSNRGFSRAADRRRLRAAPWPRELDRDPPAHARSNERAKSPGGLLARSGRRRRA